VQKRKLEDITMAIIHCSATDLPYMDDICPIRYGHIHDNGWEDVGYHFFITKRGTVQFGRKIDVVGAHARSFNSESIGICLSGEFEFKEIQFMAAAVLLDTLREYLPGLKPRWIFPHRHLNVYKTCPNFSLSRISNFSKQKAEAFLLDV